MDGKLRPIIVRMSSIVNEHIPSATEKQTVQFRSFLDCIDGGMVMKKISSAVFSRL